MKDLFQAREDWSKGAFAVSDSSLQWPHARHMIKWILHICTCIFPSRTKARLQLKVLAGYTIIASSAEPGIVSGEPVSSRHLCFGDTTRQYLCGRTRSMIKFRQYLMSLQKVCSLRISQSFLNPRSTESAVHGQSLVISFLDPLAVELDNKLASDVISALVMSLRRAWLTFIANRLKERIVI